MSAFAEPVIFEFFLGVNRCEPGNALGCHDLNNRGLELGYQVTVWPRRHHYRLTTGAESHGLGVACPVSLNQAQKQMCSILGLNELELGIFLRSWLPTPMQREKAAPTERQIRHYLRIDAVFDKNGVRA